MPLMLNRKHQDYFSLLSDEIVLTIFRWVPRFVLAKCARVCKRWSRLVLDESLWRRLDLSNRTLMPGVLGHVLSRDVSILRLAKAEAAASKNIEKLNEAVQRELMFKVKVQIPEEPTYYLPDVDPVTAEAMGNYIDHINGIPLTTSGDGDCLFNAISILLCGNETMSVKLRYHTSIKLVISWEQYMMHPQRSQTQLLCSSYVQSCLGSAVIGKFYDAWTIIALTNAINMKIRVIYPYANGTNNIAYKILYTEFKPFGTFDNRRQLAILWYKSGHVPTPGLGKWYTVNHFTAAILTNSHETCFIYYQ